MQTQNKSGVLTSLETAKNEVLCVSPETAKFPAHFQAIGNTALLRWPLILPVQCSRRDVLRDIDAKVIEALQPPQKGVS